MSPLIFLQGILIGLWVSIPMGPIGVICVQRTLHQGRLIGIISGLGAAFADTFFATAAGFGVGFVVSFFREQKFYLLLFGGLILIFLGLKLFLTNVKKQFREKKDRKKHGIVGDFFSVFFLTLSNPITVIFFGAVFSGLDALDGGWRNTLLLVGGVFSGAVLWWLTLTWLVSMFRHKFRIRSIWWLNKIAGSLIVVFGIVAILSACFGGNTVKDGDNSSSTVQLLEKIE